MDTISFGEAVDSVDEIWSGSLSHKNKAIAQVSAYTGSNLQVPIHLPKLLDVHQKVKMPEFTEKVLKKSTTSLSFESIVAQEENSLMLMAFLPSKQEPLLSSFMGFLTKSNSVGVSVLSEDESVLFFIPKELAKDGGFPELPPEINTKFSFSIFFGVLQVSNSKMTNSTLTYLNNRHKEIVENSDARNQEVKIKKQRNKRKYSNVSNKAVSVNELQENVHEITEVSNNHTPANICSDNTDVNKSSDERVADYVKSSENRENSSQLHPSDEVADRSANALVSTRLSVYMANLPSLASTINRADERQTSPQQSTPIKKKLSLGDYKARYKCKEDVQNTVDEPSQVLNITSSENISEDIIASSELEQTSAPTKLYSNKKLMENAASVHQSVLKRERDEHTSNNTKPTNEMNIEENNINVSQQEFLLSSIFNDNHSLSPNMSSPNTQSQNTVKNEMIDPDYETSCKTENIDLDAQMILPYGLKQEENSDKELHNTVDKTDMKIDDFATQSEDEQGVDELPDLENEEEYSDVLSSEDEGQHEEDSPHTTHPGEAVSFKTTELIIFKPTLYSKVLHDLDTLKFYLGERTKGGSASHKEKCMQLIDTIGDRLIGNRTRKKVVVRSIGLDSICENNIKQTLASSEVEVQTDEVQPLQENSVNSTNVTKMKKHAKNKSGKETSETLQNTLKDNYPMSQVVENVFALSSPLTESVESDCIENDRSMMSEINPDTKEIIEVNSDSEESDKTTKDSDGYFTMLLKLNGAFDQANKRKASSKTIKKTTTTTSFSVATNSSNSNEAGVSKDSVAAQVPDMHHSTTNVSNCTYANNRDAVTPEIGREVQNNNNIVTYVDGRLCFPNKASSQSNDVPAMWQGWNRCDPNTPHPIVQFLPTVYPQFNNQTQAPEAHDNSFPSNNQPFQNKQITHPTYAGTSLLQENINPIFLPDNASSNNLGIIPSNVQLDNTKNQLPVYQDVDLRKIPAFSQPVTGSSENYHENTNRNINSVDFQNKTNNTLNTGPVGTTTYFTNSVTEIIEEQNDPIDKEMREEMIDIMEILHDGSQKEKLKLKKPKGRSKRARKKRRAIAEAEKLHGLVVMAQKIESQHQTSVFSEKQKKREFYKKIINTYVKKSEQEEPKDEEAIVMECVGKLMDKQENYNFSFEDYKGLSKKRSRDEDNDCRIIKHFKPDRTRSNIKRNLEHGKPYVRPGSARQPNSSRHAINRDKSRKLPMDRTSSQFPDDVNKNQMFETWTNQRYISHLFITANKITYGSGLNKPWMSKVTPCVKSIAERKSAIKRKLHKIRKEFEDKPKLTRQEHLRTQKSLCLDNLKQLDVLNTLFNFYQKKFSILESLQNVVKQKEMKPEKYKELLNNLCEQLDKDLKRLYNLENDLDQHIKHTVKPSERKLLKDAASECSEMINTIKQEIRKYRNK